MPSILLSALLPLPKVRATHPDCSVVLYFQEQEAECLEIIRSESQTPAPPGQQGEWELPTMHGAHLPQEEGEDLLRGSLEDDPR